MFLGRNYAHAHLSLSTVFLEKILLRDFRIYESLEFSFSAGTSLFLGSNGIGKTTVLEAVYLAASLQSFRTGQLKDLIREGCARAHVEVSCETDVRHRLSIEISKSRPKALEKDGKRVRGPRFIEGLRLVALVPEHQKLLDSGAEERRKFLDRLVYSRESGFLEVLKRYQKALRHKRALLKENLPWSVFSDQVSVWNTELLTLSREIRDRRIEAVDDLKRVFREEHRQIGLGNVDLHYERSEEDLEGVLLERGRQEYAAGRVLFGPHRDDLAVLLRDRKAHQGASQGERASLLLALKFSEMKLLQENSTQPTVLLLDDLGATLDSKRRKKLFERIHQEEVQTLITTTDEKIARAAKDHQKGVSEVCLDENPAGFSFAPRLAT